LLTDELALKLRAIKNDPTLVQNSAAYNTKLAEIIDVDTQLKFFQPESYATVSSLVHIVEGIQKGRTINNNGFLGSLIENMGYERHYQTLGKGDKIQKYGVRVADALQRLINKRIADNDPNFNQLFTSSELDTLKSIVDRFNDTHKSNAGAQFQATDSFQRMQNDIATMYQLASKAINAIFK
jgi:hypothetical protein